MKKYEVICADTLKWLWDFDGKMETVFTGLPDLSETNMEFDEYKKWFVTVLNLIMKKTRDDGYVVLCMTDRKINGGTFSKANQMLNAAEENGMKLLFHKIILKQKPETINIIRVSYTHMICFSKKGTIGKATPDVIYGGRMIYPNGIGLSAVEFVGKFLLTKGITKVYELFCGRGSLPFVLTKMGFDTVNIDIDAEQVRKTNELLETLIEYE